MKSIKKSEDYPINLYSASGILYENTPYNNLIKEIIKMKHEDITIKITNNGFYVNAGCQSFVFATEKELFQAISDYNKDSEKAEKKYCRD